ncbi:cytochrome c [Reyranella sp.]|jgi:mono/diheme cytochrome c family protein|uniref:c-type cytochrome n=1 Tax=Reyranella sp. TaxID=1929291 RepID=UPI002F93DBA2
MRFPVWLKVIALVAMGVAIAGFFLTMPSRIPANSLTSRTADLANGATMFTIGGCSSCHATPHQEDRTRLGGGLSLATPFGIFNVPNISPDPTYGLGAWSEEDFVNAMKRGIGRNGEHLYPAFPYTSYQRMRLDDVRDLYAYLRTLPSVATPSRPHDLPFPFNVRRGLGLWQLLYVDGKALAPDSSRDAVWNRGAYLVEGPGHCAECHSPRNLIGGIDADRRFAGGRDAEGKGWVPNITPHPDGIPDYSVKDIAYLLETGFTPGFDSVGSSMADVVKNTSKLSPDDRLAIATYIKSLPPRPGKAPPRTNKAH